MLHLAHGTNRYAVRVSAHVGARRAMLHCQCIPRLAPRVLFGQQLHFYRIAQQIGFCVFVIWTAMGTLDNSHSIQERGLLNESGNVPLWRVREIVHARALLNDCRKRKAKELECEQMRRKRLLSKARQISVDDMLAVARSSVVEERGVTKDVDSA